MINRATRAVTVLSATALALALALAPAASGQARPISVTGVHPSGATYAIEVPRDWNGTLLTFSPGYGQGAGPQHLPADLGGEPAARNWLLAHGYALAGTRPYGDGWAVAETLRGSADTLAEFADVAGTPATTLAWGGSMGGAVAAGLAERRPDLIDGALPYCASVAGPVAMLNQSLDAAFVFKTLLAPGDDAVKLVRLASAEEETRSTTAARAALDAAQRTPAGRARIALAASFAQVSTWSVTGTPEPAARDWAAQEAQEYAAFMATVFSPRYPLEQRAGGNFSWNTGVDYRRGLRESGRMEQVRALYAGAGLNLDADLSALAAVPRVSADPGAVTYMEDYFTPRGAVGVPVLTMHERGDNYPTVTQARTYSDVVRRAGKGAMLRQVFVDRPGHCRYTGAEFVAAVQTLRTRVTTGRWTDAGAHQLGELAARLAAEDPALGAAEFIHYSPGRFLRPHVPR
ncbi:hypothetical protein [Nonomuraea glycinis]|uniref:hypothetical protein n=1 Tax=Nonomuraea glycinis TaxID=2047744 RepID=UPI002E10B029|nr:hypothetical protein OHA68_01680 [Nonomuraea glycinis]